MPVVSPELIERYDEMDEQLRDLRASVRVATDDLRQLAATLQTSDPEETYDAIVDIAKALERDAGIYRANAQQKEAEIHREG